jgi:hypothetical protein
MPTSYQCPSAGYFGYSASDFDATTHYNLVTGLGSVDAHALYAAWALQGTGTFQTIIFPNPGTQTYGVTPITLTATASSGLPVTYAVISGPATVVGSTLTITGGGVVIVQASQAGDASYSAATPVSDAFIVNPATQTITFPNPGMQTYGVSPITLTATASSGLPVTYAVTSGPATVAGSTLTITGGGVVIVQASQAGNANYSAATPVSDTVLVDPRSPRVLTLPATGENTSTPTVNGIVNPNGEATTYWFEYGSREASAKFTQTLVQTLHRNRSQRPINGTDTALGLRLPGGSPK